MNKIAQLLLWGLILGLLFFTGARTVHFLSLTFPPDQSYMPFLGLAAFDGGVLLWFFFAKEAASGDWQRGVSYIMIGVCLVGVIICTAADMFLVSNQNGLVRLPANIGMIALTGVIAVILINVVAGVVVHLLSPEHLRKWAEENAKGRIQAETLKRINQQSVQIAPDIAEQLAEQWAAEMSQSLLMAPKKKGIGVGDALMTKSKSGLKTGPTAQNQDN